MNYLKGLIIAAILCSNHAAYACNPLPKAVADAVHQHQIVMVGEYDGTNEAPQAFYDVVCAALADNPKAITVGLELTAIKGITLTNKIHYSSGWQ